MSNNPPAKRVKVGTITPPLSLLENAKDDAILHIASYLDPSELVRLSLTCRRFGSKDNENGGSGSDNDNISLMEEAAHQIINEARVEEKNALPKYEGESWITLYNELLLLRCPLTFDQLVGKGIGYPVENDKSIVTVSDTTLLQPGICNHKMRAGKHYAKFVIAGIGILRLGVMRPQKGLNKRGYDQLFAFSGYNSVNQERNERWGDSNVDACTYNSNNGECKCINWQEGGSIYTEWEGMEESRSGDVIGLLLDLDEGSLTVFKNERRLGVMKDRLSGEYCWMVLFHTQNCSVRIERAQLPAS